MSESGSGRELHQCARNGDEENLKIIIQQMQHQLEINQHDDDELSPLHYAVRYNHPSVVKLLIEKGADPNDEGEDGKTPLHYAARYRRGRKKEEEVVEEEEESEAEKSEEEGESEAEKSEEEGDLHMVAIYNHVEIARMLIEAGADLRYRDNEDSTPLHLACSEGNLEIVKMLFEAGAREPEIISKMVKDYDIEESTCLHLAVDNGHYEVAKLCLEKQADVNAQRKDSMHPLHLAAMSDDIRIVRLLVENEARIDVLNDEQETPLHKAAQFNKPQVVKYLLGRKASINCRDKDNYTPLLLAATYGRTKCVELLLKKKADYKAVDKNDRTAIYLASEENTIETLRTLLSHDDVREMINTSDKNSNGPLHIAARDGFLDIVNCLLEKGAYLDQKNDEEETPLHLAARHGRTHVVRELVKYDKSLVYDEDENSFTALHLAAMNGHDKVVRFLIELGSYVAARSYRQWTPLHLAAWKGCTKTCRILLEHDAPIDTVGNSNTTALHLASRLGHAQVVQLLLEWKANVTTQDTDGMNSLDLSIDYNNSDVAMVIVSSSVWEAALRNATPDVATGVLETPMRKLIKKMPVVAEKVFDRCLSYGGQRNPEGVDYEITFNFEFLDDAYAPWMDIKCKSSESVSPSDSAYSSDSNMLKKNHPIMIMVSSNREDLLSHPLVTSLLTHKWESFGRFIYYLLLLTFVVFLIFLTFYILSIDAPYQYPPAEVELIFSNNCTTLSKTRQKPLFAKIGKWVIFALALFNLMKELLQIYQAKLNYIGWTNLIEWITYVTALLLVIDFTECQDITGYRYTWQWSLGAVSIFLAWMDLISFIQMFPRFGIYVVMLTDVIKTFAQFSIVFLLFIVAFALSFYTLFQNQIAFRTIGHSLIKTSVMMIGEFEFDNIFNTDHTSTNIADKVYMPEMSYVFFFIFLILMSILIMNLLVGLAVDDIKAVQKQAILKRKAMQVELALDVERILPYGMKRKFYINQYTIRPNKQRNKLFDRFFKVKSSLSSHRIQKALTPDLEELKVQEKVKADLKKLKKSVKDIREQNSRVESMLSAIISEMGGISWQEEDFQEDDFEEEDEELEPNFAPHF